MKKMCIRDRLQSKGIDAAVTSQGGTKVTYKKFKNKEEAQKAMRVLSDRKEEVVQENLEAKKNLQGIWPVSYTHLKFVIWF